MIKNLPVLKDEFSCYFFLHLTMLLAQQQNKDVGLKNQHDNSEPR